MVVIVKEGTLKNSTHTQIIKMLTNFLKLTYQFNNFSIMDPR